MQKKDIKVIFIDVDGTLLGEKTTDYNPLTIEGVRKAAENGVKVFIATGRNIDNIAERAVLERIWPYITGFVSSNGQHCFLKDGTEICEHDLDSDEFRKILEVCVAHEFVILCEEGSDTFLTGMNELVVAFSKKIGMDYPKVIRPISEKDFPIRKACVYIREEDEKKYLKPILKNIYTARNADLIDLIPVGVGKESGIADVCRFYGYTVEQTMAFGDGENDVEMLRYAGIGVVMANGCPNAKAAADHETLSSDEGGVYYALKHFGVIAD